MARKTGRSYQPNIRFGEMIIRNVFANRNVNPKKRNRSKILISQKRWRESNGHKSRAHDLLNKAVKRGDLVKPTLCEKCHDAHRHIHGHHEDYEKPLEVIWLCPPCHHNRHEELLNDSKN